MKINIKFLLKAFDMFIYSQIDEHILPSMISTRSSKIPIQEIIIYLNTTFSQFDLFGTLNYYAGYYYINRTMRIPMVLSYRIEQDELIIVHNDYALSNFLSGSDQIRNLNVYKVFSLSSVLNKNAAHYYTIIGKKNRYAQSEVFKRFFSLNGDNNRLKERKLTPFEKEVQKLYDNGLLPFFIKVTPDRSLNFPPIHVGYTVSRYDYVIELRLSRKREEFLKKIMDRLDIVFGKKTILDYYNQAISNLSNEEVYLLKNIIQESTQDKDYLDLKITLSSLLITKIAKKFGIILPVELR